MTETDRGEPVKLTLEQIELYRDFFKRLMNHGINWKETIRANEERIDVICDMAIAALTAQPAQQWCEHVGGLGPPFPLCKICAERAATKGEGNG